MNAKDLVRLGVPVGEPIQRAHKFIQNFSDRPSRFQLLLAKAPAVGQAGRSPYNKLYRA